MIAALLIMVLAVNGGLYAGTIAYSTYKSNEFGKAIAMLKN